MQDVKTIIDRFELPSAPASVRELTGHRRKSYLVDLLDGDSILLQCLPSANESSEHIMRNIAELSEYCKAEDFFEEKDIIHTILTKSGEYCVVAEDGLWRASRFVNRAHVDGDEPADQKARELGRALGLFHRRFADFPVSKLNSVIPNYHNTPLHYAEFEAAVAAADKSVCEKIASELGFTQKQQSVCGALLKMDLPARVTNNHVSLRALLLDNETGSAVRLLSYDYVMPGMLPFDFGEGAASCCRTVPDGESDLSRVSLDLDLFRCYCEGYLSETKPLLVGEEPASLALSVVVMSLEHGIKELTAYLKNPDDEASLSRARVQLLLSMQAQRLYKDLVAIVRESYMANSVEAILAEVKQADNSSQAGNE